MLFILRAPSITFLILLIGIVKKNSFIINISFCEQTKNNAENMKFGFFNLKFDLGSEIPTFKKCNALNST